MVFTEKMTNGGKIFSVLWGIILPLILGLSTGRLIDAGMGYILGSFVESGVRNVAVTGASHETNSDSERRSLEGFLSANPFHISPQKTDTPPPPAEPPKPKPTEPAPDPGTALDGVILRGTLPGIGAWFDVKNVLTLLRIGNNVEGYKLISVNYGDVLFRRGEEQPIRKYIVYGPTTAVKKPEQPAPPPPAPTPAKPSEPPRETGNIVAARPDQEGQISSELVSNLVQNPFDELKRIRIRPNEKAGGLEVQWIQNDSLLKRLGVQRGDIIRSVNGVPFTNMGDIANSINSLMSSERFDVEVTRGGQNTALRYVVK